MKFGEKLIANSQPYSSPNCQKMVLVTLLYTYISLIWLSGPIWTFGEVSTQVEHLLFFDRLGETKIEELATCQEMGKKCSTEFLSNLAWRTTSTPGGYRIHFIQLPPSPG